MRLEGKDWHAAQRQLRFVIPSGSVEGGAPATPHLLPHLRQENQGVAGAPPSTLPLPNDVFSKSEIRSPKGEQIQLQCIWNVSNSAPER